MLHLPTNMLLSNPAAQFGAAGLRSYWTQLASVMMREFRWMILAMADRSEDASKALADVATVDVCDVAATRAGDSEAYARLVRRYQPEMVVQMRRFSRNQQVCEELVHDVFVEAYLSLHSYRGSAPWLHWLRKVAVRVGYRFWTRRAVNRNVVQISDEDWQRLRGDVSAPGSALEAADLVAALLDRLPPADRLILMLLYLDECSLAEAATRAGWTITRAKLRAFRARNKLKALIEQGDS